MMIGSMSDFPSIQGEGSLLNLKIDEGKWGGVDQEEIKSLITLILTKMSSILRSPVILYTTKKNTDSSAMIHNQLKTHPHFRDVTFLLDAFKHGQKMHFGISKISLVTSL